MIFTSQPDTYNSVNESLLYVVYDANAIDPLKVDYKYVGELWIGAVKVYTERAFPRPQGAFGIFDFANVIRNYIVPNNLAIENGIGEFKTKPIEVKIREEYNGTVGVIVATSNECTFFNQYLERGEYSTQINTFIGKILSDRPNTLTLPKGLNINYYIPYFNNLNTPVSTTIGGQGDSFTPSQNEVVTILNINKTSATQSYTAVINTQTLNVNLVCQGEYKNYVIHFLNKYGAFESMIFNKVSRKAFEFEKKSFIQDSYRVDNLGVATFSSFATIGGKPIMHQQHTTFINLKKETLKIQTDFLTNAEYQWLSQLVASPIVLIEEESYIYYVSVKNTNYEYKEHIVDGFTTLVLELEFTQSKTQGL